MVIQNYKRGKIIMIKLYKVNNSKDGNIKGYWLDDSSKLYKDNIELVNYSSKEKTREAIRELFAGGEQAVFYTVNENIAYLENTSGDVTELKNKKLIKIYHPLTKKDIEKLARQYGGLTVYTRFDGYTVEIWEA